ncbi:trypsin 5G1-like isoform X2 [Periplaneta americana]|uniref:trypsin 5G1-like isoform X2 n=1 Tax=Periplaneta americana TaxID=6978 RepID=UPI0037E84B89
MLGVFVIVLLFISSSESAPNEAYPRRSGRIIGGADGASIEEFPYQVQLEIQTSESFYCSGSIISDEWIVTSTKCIPVGPVGVLIRAGGDILGPGVSLHYQVYRYRHPNFDGYNYDVGLMSTA